MPHYMFRATYSQQGIQGVIKDGAASRVAAVEAMAASVGGRISPAYWAFGDVDFFAIAELPDNAAAMAIAATVGASRNGRRDDDGAADGGRGGRGARAQDDLPGAGHLTATTSGDQRPAPDQRGRVTNTPQPR